jgi:hypothetical protein
MGRPKKTDEPKVMIRVHNRGKREYLIPAVDGNGKRIKGEAPKKLISGRAIELPEAQAKKYLAAYPDDLINFEDLVAGGGRANDLKKDNTRLKAQNRKLEDRIAELEAALADVQAPAEPDPADVTGEPGSDAAGGAEGAE